MFVIHSLLHHKGDSRFLGRFGGVFSQLRTHLKRHYSFNFLLFLLSCYIVASRIGPFVGKAGDLAIETFEVERRIVEEFDHEALQLFREAFFKFRVVTRAPSPALLFSRFPGQDSTSLLVSTMGTTGSKNKAPNNKSDSSTASPPSEQTGEVAVKKDAAPLQEEPPDTTATVTVTEGSAGERKEEEGGGEGAGEGGGEGEREGGEGEKEGEGEAAGEEGEEGEEDGEDSSEVRRKKSASPADVDAHPFNRLNELRNKSNASFPMGSTESIVGLFGQKQLNPADYKKPIKFKKIQPTIRTGDLALLYRRDVPLPHLAIFINHAENDPLFPLLLVKGKTKPLPLEKFEPQKPRFIHPITATTRIFYGDYEKVAIQYVQSEDGIDEQQAMDSINAVEAIQFTDKERKVIMDAKTDPERSLYMTTFTAAYYYRELGIFHGTPDEVTPWNILSQLPLSDPIYVKLPTVKLGPMAHGDPPFLKQLVDGIYPAQNIKAVPYDKAIEELDTGDIILFSGATSQGAIIKFFDHSQFSHVAMVLKAKYTSQLLIWEASTNHAKLVDVQAGSVRTGVEVLPLRHKVFSGWYDRVAVRRLMNMTTEKRQELYQTMLKLRKEWIGRDYEKNMVQLSLAAINPSDSFFSLFQNTHEDLSSLFCSELVAAAYQRMGIIKSDRASNSYTPDDFSSSRDSSILSDGVELGEEVYIELKWPPT